MALEDSGKIGPARTVTASCSRAAPGSRHRLTSRLRRKLSTEMARLAERVLGQRNMGCLDYYFGARSSWDQGQPFNGQEYRRRIFEELMAAMPWKALVETGTFRGTTTQFLARWGLPVYSVELSRRQFAFARLRLRKYRERVHLYQGDSRRFLTQLADDPQFPRTNVFFYLDAHWNDDLPLKEEVALIFQTWREAVVMIDDFQVPGSSYGYDDYGPGKALNLDYLSALADLHLHYLFPVLPAEQETGLKRGCVVVCREDSILQLRAPRACWRLRGRSRSPAGNRSAAGQAARRRGSAAAQAIQELGRTCR